MKCPFCGSRHGGCRHCNPSHPDYVNSEFPLLREINSELLEALSDIVEACSPPGVPNLDYVLKTAQDAIAKATAKGK